MKNKKNKILIALLVLMMVVMYGYVPRPSTVNAVDSITQASDLMSDTDLNVTANHTFTFTTGTSTPLGGWIEVAFRSTDWGTTTAANITCPGLGVESTQDGDYTARCTYAAGEVAGAKTLTIVNMLNPATSSTYYIDITNRDSSDVVLERVTVAVRVIQDVLMTATVNSSLTFTVSGTSTGATVNGVNCDEDTTATTTPFGTLDFDPRTVCQDLSVASNATEGFSVTVWADGELTSDGGANINSFNNSPTGSGSSTLAELSDWTPPLNILDNYNTYGHMGLTSADATLDNGVWGAVDPFDVGGAAADYAGFNSTDPIQVMYHDGPTLGNNAGKGYTSVAYTVEIDSLQEAGDYETTLTYICTPVY